MNQNFDSNEMPTQQIPFSQFKQRNFRSFLFLVLFLIFAVVAFFAIQNAEKEIQIQWPLRRILDLNGRLAESVVSPTRLDTAVFAPPPRIQRPRENGDVGLTSPIDLKAWRLHVDSEDESSTKANSALTLDDLKRLPMTTENVQFKCVEGWSEVMSFGGVRFSDFLKAEHLGTKSGRDIDLENHPEDIYRYVGFQTPDEEYYVSVDTKSLLASTALLAYEQNGAPLSIGHGAPLRLYAPNKYGIKSIKRIGKITFTDERPGDYWQDEGYDWFAGL